MPSFFDLMKYARTGIASPDMTGFDKLRARAAFGGYPVSTITGIPPISFKADGKPLTAWSIAGNGQQTGTPTPDAPTMPEFVGVRTGNLLDYSTVQNGYTLDSTTGLPVSYPQRIANTTPIIIPESTSTVILTYTPNHTFMYSIFRNGELFARQTTQFSGTAISVNAGDALYLCWYKSGETLTKDGISDAMLNLGSTALPYEPYGLAEKITCAGQTVPVYLGQTQTVRRIKKIVFDGTENITFDTQGASGVGFRVTLSDMLSNGRTTGLCSHFVAQATPSGSTLDGVTYGAGNSVLYVTFSTATATALNITDETSVKAYLAQQYANGTPVTVWYVLAEPTTGIVNEPLCKIGTYADELHSTDAGVTIPTVRGSNTLTVDTTLQPSAVSVTGHIQLTLS